MMRWPEAVTSRLDQMGNVDIRENQERVLNGREGRRGGGLDWKK